MPDLTTPTFSFTEPTIGADSGIWGGVLNTDIINLDTYLGVLRQAAKALGNVSGAVSLDFNAPASVWTMTVTGAITLSVANTPANITTQQLSTMMTLIITNGGAFTITWPASFTWVAGGVAPSLQASGVDIVVAWSPNNGTNWYASALFSQGGGKNVIIYAPTAGGSTSGNTEVSLGTVTVPAGKLAAVGDAVRITAVFDPTSNPNNIFVKFGATYVLASTSITARTRVIIDVVRTGATSQLAVANVDGAAAVYTVPTETLSGAVVVDFRGNALFNGTLTLRVGRVEALTA